MATGRFEMVPLGLMVPSEGNPRRDFENIGFLADRIRATGGQPVNPVVVVRDGDRFRIVDGERRYRAMRKIGATECAALVYEDYGEAHEAVAMVATDDKQPLTAEEQARGFQQMLRLDVPTESIARALGRSANDVRRARRVAASAGEQATLDQMVAAGEFEGEDAQRVLDAGEDWARVAESTRRRIEREQAMAPLLAKAAELGIEVVDRLPEGYLTWRNYAECGDARSLEEFAAAHEGEALVAYESGTFMGPGLRVCAPVAEEEPRETEEERAERERGERRTRAASSLLRALRRFAATHDPLGSLSVEAGALRPEVKGWYCDSLVKRLTGDDAMSDNVDESDALAVASSPASTYELLDWALTTQTHWATLATRLLPAAVDDGFESSVEDAWLMHEGFRELERMSAKEDEQDAE